MKKLRKVVNVKALANNDGTLRGKSRSATSVISNLSSKRKRKGRERERRGERGGLISLVAIYFAFCFVTYTI